LESSGCSFIHQTEKLHTANNSTLVSGQQTLNFEKSIGLEHGQQNSSNITYSPVLKRGWETEIGQKISKNSGLNGNISCKWWIVSSTFDDTGGYKKLDPLKSACFLNR